MSLQLFIKTDEKDLYKDHSAAFKGDSGIDVFFPENVVVPAGDTVLIDLKICCELREISSNFAATGQSFFSNKSFYLYPRSSIFKTPLRMANSVGIIDSGYRNTLKVAVDNTSDVDYPIERGDRLFQICSPCLGNITIFLTDSLSSTERGEGFGSSGTKKV